MRSPVIECDFDMPLTMIAFGERPLIDGGGDSNHSSRYTSSLTTSASCFSAARAIARELSRVVQFIIAVQPTRGLDVGSIEFIHKQLIAARDFGVAVLLISAELDEILALSDRIAVMYKGAILDILPAKEATREKLGLLMAGVKA